MVAALYAMEAVRRAGIPLKKKVRLILGCDEETENSVRFLEKEFGKNDSGYSGKTVLPILKILLSGKKTLDLAGNTFNAPAGLAEYLQAFADKSKSALSRAAKPLFPDEHSMDPLFEAWLIAHGFRHEVTLWKGRFGDGRGTAAEEIVLDEEPESAAGEAAPEAEEFTGAPEGFEEKFTELLTLYRDRVEDPAVFEALMSDYFPLNKMECFLLVTLQRMDIIRAATESAEADEIISVRFGQRLVRDFGVREPFAVWAVGVWLRSLRNAARRAEAPPDAAPDQT